MNIELSVGDKIFIVGVFVGVIIGMFFIAGTAYFFGCHFALGDLCMVVRP